MLSPTRIGKFTSSTIHNLMKKGKGDAPSTATLSYIEDKRMEKRLGRELNSDTSARATIWGSLLEKRLFSLLDPFEYTYCSTETITHPTITTWAGTPDFLTKTKVCDGKCPYTMKAFCQLADICIAGDVERLKSDKPEYYWQLVSNAVLTGKSTAELIVYCPYKSELNRVRELAENEEEDQNKLAWIYFSEDKDLPYLVDGGYYQNLYKLEFEVSEEDCISLTSAVIKASKLLD